jgi:hypothetical protein
MAEQRRSEPGGHGARRRACGRGLAGLLSLSLLLAGCDGGPVAPPTGGLPSGGGGLGPGSSAGGGAEAALLGTWQTVVVVQVPDDLQTWTTVWRFDAGGTCRQTKVTESLAEGFPRTTERACTWTVSDVQIAVGFTGGGTLAMKFSFAGLSPDRLVLDGFEYQRQP